MASPFLSALASIGSQYAQGRTEGLEEKEKLAQEKARTGLEQTQQELERARLNYQMKQLADYEAEAPVRAAKAKQDAAKADYIDIYTPQGRRTWSISQQKLVAPEQASLADPTNARYFQQAQGYIAEQDPKIRPELNRRLAFGFSTGEPWDKIRANLETQVDKYNADKAKGGGGANADDLLSTLPEAVKGNWDQDVTDKFQRRVQWELTHSKNPDAEIDKAFTEADNTMKARAAAKAAAAKEVAKSQELTAGASKAIMTTLPTVASVNDMLKDIDKSGLGNNNQAGYFRGAYMLYRMGYRPPVNTLKDDIAGFSLGSVTEAVSALQGSTRAYAALQLALIHTPNPFWDSPAQVKGKLENIRTRLNRIVQFARIFGTKGQAPPLDQAMRMVGTPENEIQMMMGQPGQQGGGQPSPTTDIPAPLAPANTDVKTTPTPATPTAPGRDQNNPLGLDLTPR